MINVFDLIAKLSFIGFYMFAFAHKKREGVTEKKPVIMKQGKQEGIEITNNVIQSRWLETGDN